MLRSGSWGTSGESGVVVLVVVFLVNVVNVVHAGVAAGLGEPTAVPTRVHPPSDTTGKGLMGKDRGSISGFLGHPKEPCGQFR